MPVGSRRISVEIVGDASGLSQAFGKAAKDADDFGSKMERVGGRLRAWGAGLTAAVSLPLAAASGAAIKAASDFGETQSKAHTVFRGIEADIDSMAQTAIDRVGMSRQTFLDFLSTAGAVGQGLGMTRDESLKLADSVVTLTSDFASFHNLPHEQVSNAIISALTGEREGLKQLGIVISEADVQKKALVQTGKTHVDQLTQEEKANATLALIYERAGVAVGDYSRTKDSAANRSRVVKERLEELSITLGERLLPLFERALDVITPVLDKFSTMDTSTQNLVLGAGALAIALGPVITAVGALIPLVQGLAAAAMWLYANPVGLLIGALALLAIGLVKAYQESDEFRRVVDVIIDVLQVGFLTAIRTGLVALQQIGGGLMLAAESALTFGAALLGWTTPAAMALRNAREDISATRVRFNDELTAIIKRIDISVEAHIGQALAGIADVRAQAAALTRQRYTVFIDAEGPGLVATRGVGHMRGGVTQRQHGGPVWPGQPFLVGEEGPELFWPRGAGRIIPGRLGPAVTTGGGGQVNVTNEFHFHGAVADRRQVVDWVTRAIRDHARNNGGSAALLGLKR